MIRDARSRRKAQPPLDVLLLLDTEDLFSPVELGNDDSTLELANILTEERVRGAFLFFSDYARVLQERKRRDVIEAVKRHEVGLHGKSPFHPCGAELVAGKSWEEGLEVVLRHEREGVEAIREVFGRPCCALSEHGSYGTPQQHRAAAILGLPLMYGNVAAPPAVNVSWYAGSLCFPAGAPSISGAKACRGYFGGLENAYPDDRAFAQYMPRLEQHLADCRSEAVPATIVHICNPDRVRLREFLDRYAAPNGVNYPRKEWGRHGVPRRATPAEIATTLKNFRRLVRRLRDDRTLRLLTVAEAAARYGKQPAKISREELFAAAKEIVRDKKVLIHPRFTPAEVLMAMAEAVGRFEKDRAVPRELPRRDALGPTRVPPIIPEVFDCDWATLLQRAKDVMQHVRRTGHLPALLGRRWQRIGVNHLYGALAQALVALAGGRKPEGVAFERVMPRYPEIAGPVGLNYVQRMCDHLHDPNLNVNAVFRHSQLQTWTLKPATPTD